MYGVRRTTDRVLEYRVLLHVCTEISMAINLRTAQRAFVLVGMMFTLELGDGTGESTQ